MPNPFPFVSGSVLYASQLNQIGDSETWTITWTNLTVGNGTVNQAFTRINDMVIGYVAISWGSTTSASGNITFSLPVTAVNTSQRQIGSATMLDSGVAFFEGVTVLNNTTSAIIVPSAANGTYVYQNGTAANATTPFTWTTNDILYAYFSYQAA